MKSLPIALLAGMTLISGGAMAQSFGPPPPQIETGPLPPIPGPGYELVPGRWAWNGVRYVWKPRHYVLRPVGYASWVPGHWAVNRFGQYQWVEGHWRP